MIVMLTTENHRTKTQFLISEATMRTIIKKVRLQSWHHHCWMQPVLHAIASASSSCVEMPKKQLFLTLRAAKGCGVHGADAQDAHAHATAH